jgi:hypothetical protein
MISSELGLWAQVFPVALTEGTTSAGGMEPGHAYPIPGLEPEYSLAPLCHYPHHLMAGDDWLLGQRKLALYHMEISMADPTHVHPHQQFIRPRLWLREMNQLQGISFHWPGMAQDHSFHYYYPLLSMSLCW